MEDEQKSKAVCKRCARMLKHGETEYCLKCKIELAEEHVPDNDTVFIQPSRKPNKIWTIGKWVVLIFFTGLIVVNSIVLIKLFLGQQPAEFVPPGIRIDAEICRTNLEEIGKLLEDGILPSDTIICPMSGKPYLVEIKNRDTIISCPNPEKHELKMLWVSSRNPEPEVIR